jgi:hypothetical protein
VLAHIPARSGQTGEAAKFSVCHNVCQRSLRLTSPSWSRGRRCSSEAPAPSPSP